MQEVNKDLWTKASLVAKGIRRLIWTYTDFYIFNHDISEELDVYNVYLNDYGRFSVKLDNGSEFFLVQPCPHLIYELYEAKAKADNGNSCDENTAILAKAYDKFERFFKHMIIYCSIELMWKFILYFLCVIGREASFSTYYYLLKTYGVIKKFFLKLKIDEIKIIVYKK